LAIRAEALVPVSFKQACALPFGFGAHMSLVSARAVLNPAQESASFWPFRQKKSRNQAAALLSGNSQAGLPRRGSARFARILGGFVQPLYTMTEMPRWFVHPINAPNKQSRAERRQSFSHICSMTLGFCKLRGKRSARADADSKNRLWLQKRAASKFSQYCDVIQHKPRRRFRIGCGFSKMGSSGYRLQGQASSFGKPLIPQTRIFRFDGALSQTRK
jgi:hypothetical protein